MKIKKNAAKAAAVPSANTAADPTPKVTRVAAPSEAETIIDVNHDVGFGNTLFLRGQGAGLNWEQGVPLKCVDGKTWRWSGKVKDPLTFKLLINDKVWSAGHDLIVKPGQKLQVKPNFS